MDLDTCASEDFYRSAPLLGNVTLIKLVPAPPVPGSPVVYRCIFNDPLGRVTECDHDALHRCVAVREFTGFATPGVPVTDTTNRPDPGTRLRAGDPPSYETTFRYNSESCMTRITHPDGTRERFVYGKEWVKPCPVRERGNLHHVTLRTPGGEERSVTYDYLPGFGTPEGTGDNPMVGGVEHKTSSNIQNNFTSGDGGISDDDDDDGGCTDALARGGSTARAAASAWTLPTMS